MKKKVLLSSVVLALLTALVLPIEAFAGGNGYCEESQQGCDKAFEQTECAGHGAFGAFSDPNRHGTPYQPPYFGDDELGSARRGATGDNNSGLCGSPQN